MLPRLHAVLVPLCLAACTPSITEPPEPDAGTTSPYPVLAKARASKVQVGVGYACAVTTDGKVRCWGQASSFGAAGAGDHYHFGTPAWTRDIPEPVEVPGLSDVVDLSIQYSHACALTRAKKAICWGRNSEGQVGNGTDVNPTAPYELPLTNVKKVRVGTDQHGFGLLLG